MKPLTKDECSALILAELKRKKRKVEVMVNQYQYDACNSMRRARKTPWRMKGYVDKY